MKLLTVLQGVALLLLAVGAALASDIRPEPLNPLCTHHVDAVCEAQTTVY